MRGVTGLTALAFLLLAPLAGAQAETAATVETKVEPDAVDTTLYFHLIDIMDMPINTQVPQYAYTEAGGYGPTANTLRCLHPTTGAVTMGSTSQDFATWYGYSSASYVEYDHTSADNKPRTHPERTLGYDVALENTTPVLHWFLAEQGPVAEDGVPVAGGAANVVLRVVLGSSDAVSVDDKAYDEGTPILEGLTPPVTVAGGQVSGDGAALVEATQVDGVWVYGWSMPLDMLGNVLPGDKGFWSKVEAFVANPACDEETVMPGTLGPYADAAHQPRLDLRNRVPLRVDGAAVSTENGTLVLNWTTMSPWGNYDVDVRNATLEVTGPSEVAVALVETIQRYTEHYHLMDPVQQVWHADASALADGSYTAVFTVQNLQHTATATATVAFQVDDRRIVEEPVKEAPGPGPLLLVAFALVGFALRRRT